MASAVKQKNCNNFARVYKNTQNKNERSGSSGSKSGENVDGCTMQIAKYFVLVWTYRNQFKHESVCHSYLLF